MAGSDEVEASQSPATHSDSRPGPADSAPEQKEPPVSDEDDPDDDDDEPAAESTGVGDETANPPPVPNAPEGTEQKGRFIKWLFGEGQGNLANANPDDNEDGFVSNPPLEREAATNVMDTRTQQTLAEMARKLTALTEHAVASGTFQKNLQGSLQKLYDSVSKAQETTIRRLDRLYEAVRLVAAELRQILTLTQQHVQAAATAAPAAAAAPAPAATRQVKVARGPDPASSNDPEHKKARRIANAMVSDLEAYNRGKLEESVKQGTTIQVLEKAINDMRAAYQRRVSERVQKEYDYLTETLIQLLGRKRKELTGSEDPPANTPDADFEGSRPGMETVSVEETATAAASGSAPAAPAVNPNVVLSGRIYKEFLPDLIQQLSQNMETGIFRIFPKGLPDGQCLEIFYVDGDIYNCKGPSADGEKAFFDAIQVKDGRFEFELSKNESIERRIQSQTSFLVLEAFKQQDESAITRDD